MHTFANLSECECSQCELDSNWRWIAFHQMTRVVVLWSKAAALRLRALHSSTKGWPAGGQNYEQSVAEYEKI